MPSFVESGSAEGAAARRAKPSCATPHDSLGCRHDVRDAKGAARRHGEALPSRWRPPPTKEEERYSIGHALARAKTVATMAKIAGARWREHASGALMGAAPMTEPKFLKLVKDGGEVLQIPRRTAWTQAFSLRAGASLRWEFRVQSHDLGFALHGEPCRRAGRRGRRRGCEALSGGRRRGRRLDGDRTVYCCCCVRQRLFVVDSKKGGGQVFGQ